MLSITRGLVSFVSLSAIAMCFFVDDALAGYQVTPTKVRIPAKSASSLLKIKNSSSQGTRFQISVYSWDQTADDQMVLEKTTDVFVYPSLLSVPAGASRSFRVGAKSVSRLNEGAYRIMVTELPPLRPLDRQGVSVLTQMSIPVFLSANKEKTRAELKKWTVDGTQIRFQVENPGSMHFMLKSVELAGYDKANNRLFRKKATGWYVLSRASRQFHIEIKPAECEQLARVEVTTDTSVGQWQKTFSIGATRCGNE